MIDNKILQLAQNTRSWALAIAKDIKPDDPRGWNSSLTNMCVMCSTHLAYHMHHAGYTDVQIIDAGMHTFVMLNNVVIDVTATQFGEFDDVLVIRYNGIKDKTLMWSEIEDQPKIKIKPWCDKEFGLEVMCGIDSIISMMKIHIDKDLFKFDF